MSDAVVVALITLGASVVVALITLLGNILSNKAMNTKMMNEIKTEYSVSQARTDERMTELTREVRKHNNFAERVPVIEEQIRVANHRIDDLERKVDK